MRPQRLPQPEVRSLCHRHSAPGRRLLRQVPSSRSRDSGLRVYDQARGPPVRSNVGFGGLTAMWTTTSKSATQLSTAVYCAASRGDRSALYLAAAEAADAMGVIFRECAEDGAFAPDAAASLATAVKHAATALYGHRRATRASCGESDCRHCG